MPGTTRIGRTAGRIWRDRFFQTSLIIIGVIGWSAVAVVFFEEATEGSNIRSIWDGVWWAVVTMGTVGYGDRYPVSFGGRMIGLLLIFAGVGLMSLFTATVASLFVERRLREGRGLKTVKSQDHLIICGWNEHGDEVLQGLIAYQTLEDMEVVLINEMAPDAMEALKLRYDHYPLRFLRGDYVHEDVLRRANVAKARFVLLLADALGGHGDRADERTTLAALAVKSLAPGVRAIAEIIESSNRSHLRRAGVDEIVVRGEHVGALLAGAIHAPGLPRIISHILSLGETNKLFRVAIPRAFVGRTFGDLSAHFRLKGQAILIGFLKEKKTMKLEDVLSDNTSVIDRFIRDRIRESKKSFLFEGGQGRVVVNPGDDYLVGPDDHAVVLARNMPGEE